MDMQLPLVNLIVAQWRHMAPSHYRNQYWVFIGEVLGRSPEENFPGNAQDAYSWYEFENF